MNRKRTAPQREDRQAWTECFLLCDYARAEHGKLVVRWELIVAQALIRVELLNQEGNVLGEPVAETRLERSPIDVPAEFAELTPFAALFMGSEVNMALAAPGVFTLILSVNELEVASLRFRVVPPREPKREAEDTQ